MFFISKILNDKLKCVLVLFLFILCLNMVSAANDTDTNILSDDNQNEIIKMDNTNTTTVDEELKAGSNVGTFKDLNELLKSSSTVTLNKDYAFDSSKDADFINGINISSARMTINGNGHSIDGKGSAKIFTVKGTRVTLNNINFINGKSTQGGAITWEGYLGKIVNCKFINNSVTDYNDPKSLSKGGAIYWLGYSGSISNSVFINNSVEVNESLVRDVTDEDDVLYGYGGAIEWEIDAGQISNCVFEGNRAFDAGAIDWGSWNGKIENCNFTNNIAYGLDAGAIDFYSRSGQLINCYFINNTCDNYGGAVYWDNALDRNFTYGYLAQCTFIGNKAINGGGGAVAWYGNIGTISTSVFINNTALNDVDDEDHPPYGGAIEWIGNGGNIVDCTFIGNSAINSGAVDFIGNNSIICGCNFTNNYARGEGDGGAIDWLGYNGTIYNCYFNNNAASYNGGGINWQGDEGYIFNCTFINNTAIINQGGGMFVKGNLAIVFNCTFINNTASNNTFDEEKASQEVGCFGGAIEWLGNNGTLRYSVFIGNNAFNSGAVDFVGNDSMMIGCNFSSNHARISITKYGEEIPGDGGAVDWTGNNGIMINCTFNNNYAPYNGGAVCWNGDFSSIVNCTFTNNSAVNAGAAVYIYGGMSNIISSTFLDNPSVYGGGIFLEDSSNIIGNVFIRNLATNEYNEGGAIYCNSSEVTINYNVFLGSSKFNNTVFIFNDTDCDYNWWGSNAEVNASNIPINKSLIFNVTVDMSLGFDMIQAKINHVYDRNTGEISVLSDEDYNKVPARFAEFKVLSGNIEIQNSTTHKAPKITLKDPMMINFTAQVTVDDQVLFFNKTRILYTNNSFSELQLIINGTENNTLILFKNFTYDPVNDKDFLSDFFKINGTGLLLNNNITIIGNGCYIDALGLTPIFNVNSNVSFINITFINGTIINNGVTNVSNSKFNNASFANNNYLIIEEGNEDVLVNNSGVVKLPCSLIVNNQTTSIFNNVSLTLKDFMNIIINPKIYFEIYNNESVLIANLTPYSDSETGLTANYTFDNPGYYNLAVWYEGIEVENVVNGTIFVDKINPKYYIFAPDVATVGDYVTITIAAVDSSNYIVTIDGIVQSSDTIVYPVTTAGVYTIQVSSDMNDTHNPSMAVKTITVYNKKVLGNVFIKCDKSTDYSKSAKCVIRVLYNDGSPYAGARVVYNFNGKNYFGNTDSSGFLVLSLKNDNPGVHSVYIFVEGHKFSKKIDYKSVISVKKKTIFKKHKKSLKIKVTVKGKSPFKNVEVKVKLKGKEFKAKTNDKGEASVKIKKSVLKKLKRGKTYKFKASYQKDEVNGKIKVRR